MNHQILSKRNNATVGQALFKRKKYINLGRSGL